MHILSAFSSQAAFVTQANAAHYGASKAALTAVLNALRLEEPEFHIMAVHPDLSIHHFIKRQTRHLLFNKYKLIMIDAEQLAERIILGILKNKKKSINLVDA